MNEFEEFLNATMQTLTGESAKLTTAMGSIPPGAQLADNPELATAARTISSSGQGVLDTMSKLESQMKAAPAKFQEILNKQVKEHLESERKAGNIVTKDDHEAALDIAKTNAQKEVRDEMEKKEGVKKQAEEKRTTLLGTFPVVVCQSLSDDDVVSADFDSKIKPKLEERVKQLKEVGVKDELGAMKKATDVGFDEGSDEAFAGEVKLLKELLGGKPDSNPKVPTPGGGGGGDDKKVIC